MYLVYPAGNCHSAQTLVMHFLLEILIIFCVRVICQNSSQLRRELRRKDRGEWLHWKNQQIYKCIWMNKNSTLAKADICLVRFT